MKQARLKRATTLPLPTGRIRARARPHFPVQRRVARRIGHSTSRRPAGAVYVDRPEVPPYRPFCRPFCRPVRTGRLSGTESSCMAAIPSWLVAPDRRGGNAGICPRSVAVPLASTPGSAPPARSRLTVRVLRCAPAFSGCASEYVTTPSQRSRATREWSRTAGALKSCGGAGA
jgi:hypothetical protein